MPFTPNECEKKLDELWWRLIALWWFTTFWSFKRLRNRLRGGLYSIASNDYFCPAMLRTPDAPHTFQSCARTLRGEKLGAEIMPPIAVQSFYGAHLSTNESHTQDLIPPKTYLVCRYSSTLSPSKSFYTKARRSRWLTAVTEITQLMQIPTHNLCSAYSY